jgi:repressor LexA
VGDVRLSPRQKQVLEVIEKSIADYGYPPTLREIGSALSINSTNAVNDHLKALERKGAIWRDSARSRGISLTDRNRRSVATADSSGGSFEVPILGRIAAGVPLLAEENVEGSVALDPMFRSPSSPVFALKVVGDSMIEDGILEDDIIVVRAQDTARQGDTVVALIDGEATVKRFYREDDRIRLQPANRDMKPIFILAEEGRETLIQGVVVGVMRCLDRAE